ncbi:arylamine N-acetyltransferase [Marinomonas arenicola]|uniref:arylamine N-acetyltransferase family protein n=1 Tax=Marinomonas arenicola TaxID=569601 RepID=UPI00311F325E
MKTLSPELQHYLTDLGLAAPHQPSLAFVQQLQGRHVARHSFNSLSVVLGEALPLDLASLSDKFVTRGLGGYCFEHNKLTFELLAALGYEVQLVLARVLNNRDINAPRTHRVTLLTLDGSRYLIDTGFGANGPISPLQLTSGLRQTSGLDHYQVTSHETCFGVREYELQIEKDQAFFTLYRFDLATYSDADCELGHFYSHKHPHAVFVNNLMVSVKDQQRTASLQNENFKMVTRDGTQIQQIESAEALQSLLADVFSIALELVVAEHLFDRFIGAKWIAEKRREQ